MYFSTGQYRPFLLESYTPDVCRYRSVFVSLYYIMTFHDMVQLMMYSLVQCHGAHKISTDLQTYRPVQASTYTYINVQTCTGQYVHVHTRTYAYMLFLTL